MELSGVAARAGTGDIAAALRQRPCTIAYLGASVTVQREGYRPRLHEWLTRTTGQPHRAVNAGLGAIGSVSAVFTMDELVLRHRPDVCFVEYSSGDIERQSPPAQLGPAVEGMLRKLRGARCHPIVLHLYRADRRFEPPDRVLEVWERLADHYGVPSLSPGAEIARRLAAGEWRHEDLFHDGIHTTARGTEVVTSLLAGGLREIWRAAGSALPPPAPLHPAPYERTDIVPITPSMLRHPERHTRGRLRFFYDYLAIESDNAIECRNEAIVVGVAFVVGPRAGYVRVRTPGLARDHLLWDEESSYERFGTLIFDPPLPAGTPLVIEVLDTPVDRSCWRRPIPGADSLRTALAAIGLLTL